ncbi:beta strand repeat-containing protein [Methylobacterium persicinum]
MVGDNAATITGAYAIGTATATSADPLSSTSYGRAGGLTGSNSGRISQVWTSGAVSASKSGGLSGLNDAQGTFTAAFWDADSTHMSSAFGGNDNTSSGTPIKVVSSNRRALSAYVVRNDNTNSLDFTNVWYRSGTMRPMLRAEAQPADSDGIIAVSNLHQLQLIDATPSGKYRLTSDIDASTKTYTNDSPDIWGLTGFQPLSASGSGFSGSIDGAGRVIRKLTINQPGTLYAALFGILGAAGSISNIGLVDGNVIGGSTSALLVGTSFGKIANVYATGSVSGVRTIGGLVGSVSDQSATLSYAYSTVNVTGSDGNVGGLVGENVGSISEAYATGNVSGGNNTGGLVGFNNGSIDHAYAVGKVIMTTGSHVGGLIGAVDNQSKISGLFWNTETTKQANGIGTGGSTGITGLTTAQMQDLSSYEATYNGFDFDATWSPPNSAGKGGQADAHYPELYKLTPVLTVTYMGATTYGTTNADPMKTFVGLRAGDFVYETPTATLASKSDVGRYAALSGGKISGSRTYRIIDAGTITVQPIKLIVTGQKAYDGTGNFTAAQLTATGGPQDETITVADGSGRATSVDVGEYSDRPFDNLKITVANGKSSNYLLALTGKLTITPKTLTLVGTKTYDGKAGFGLSQIAIQGVVGTDTATLVGGTGDVASAASANAGIDEAGTFSGLDFNLSGSPKSNYVLPKSAQLTITKTTLTGTAKNVSKDYDGKALIGGAGVTYEGFVNGETEAVLGGSLTYGGPAKDATKAGTYVLTASGQTSNNYDITYKPGTLTIARVKLTASVKEVSKSYDGKPFDANDVLTYDGFVNDETVAVLGGSPSYGGTAPGAKQPGTYTLTAAGQTSDNYDISYKPGTLTISKRPVTVVISNETKVYDGQGYPGASATIENLADGEDPSVLGGQFQLGGDWKGATNVGRYSITGSGYTSNNYDISYKPGTLTITKAPLTASFEDPTWGDKVVKVYDGTPNAPLPAGTVHLSTVFRDDDVTATGTARYVDSNVGYHKLVTVTGLTLSGAAVGNYELINDTASEYTGLISPAPLTVIVNNAAKTYDGKAFSGGNGFTYKGFLGQDDESVLHGSFTYRGSAQGAKQAGRYVVAGSGLSADNYGVNYQNGTLTISPAPVVVTALGGTSTYGETASNPGFTATGLVDGEGIDALKGLSNNFSITPQTGVSGSPYTLSVTGTVANGNYIVTERRDATWTVTPRTLGVTAKAASRPIGDANPDFTYDTRGLVNGDGLSGALTTTADAASPEGGYPITQGTLSAGANYSLSYTGADLTVTAKPASGSTAGGSSQPVTASGTSPGNGTNPSSGSSSGTNDPTGAATGTTSPGAGAASGTAAPSNPSSSGTSSPVKADSGTTSSKAGAGGASTTNAADRGGNGAMSPAGTAAPASTDLASTAAQAPASQAPAASTSPHTKRNRTRMARPSQRTPVSDPRSPASQRRAASRINRPLQVQGRVAAASSRNPIAAEADASPHGDRYPLPQPSDPRSSADRAPAPRNREAFYRSVSFSSIRRFLA